MKDARDPGLGKHIIRINSTPVRFVERAVDRAGEGKVVPVDQNVNEDPQEVDIPFVWRVFMGIVLAASGAFMFTLAFPPYDVWQLAFFWVVPVMVAVHRIMPTRLSGVAMGIGVGGFFWGYFAGMFSGYWFMQWLPVFIGITAALTSWRERRFHARTGYRWMVLHGAFMWVGVEMIRGFIPVIGTWGFAAYTLYEQPWLIQPVSVFGIYGMSLIIMLFNFACAKFIIAEIDKRWIFECDDYLICRKQALRWFGAVCVLLILWTVMSAAMYRSPEPELTTAAVQPAAYISPETDAEGIERGLAMIKQQTIEAAEQGARFIVWPEAFLPFDPQEKETSFFQQLSAETGAYLTLGYGVQTEKGLRNEATVLSPEGEFLGVFGKDHPVVFAGETSITRGTYPVHDTSIGGVGTIICYDLDFTDTARKVARNGAQIIGVPSWDWPSVAHKHYSHVVFRAVENRAAMVKADTAYDSAVIDPYGNIVQKHVSSEPEAVVVVGSVALFEGETVNMMLGDWVGWISLVGMMFFTGFALYTAKSLKAEDQ